MTWQQIGELSPDAIKQRGIFPYPALPHPLHANGGQVFPKMQIDLFPRLERFDVDFDIPEVFLPEFPPAIFLSNRPDLGDVSRGEVVSINNFYKLFKDILTPVQLDGLQMLLTPLPQRVSCSKSAFVVPDRRCHRSPERELNQGMSIPRER
jgi:hypothetical protein